MTTSTESTTFAFGKNWQSFLETLSPDAVDGARRDIEDWLGSRGIRNRTVVDVGCGSGIHSLCFHMLGAARVVSLDVDVQSVSATRSLWERAGGPANWQVLHGSALDKPFLASLGTFDIVYSWGVLHHTGSMWQAVSNVAGLVADAGVFWLALYVKGPRYAEDLALKQRYNAASALGRKSMIARRVAHRMWRLLRQGRNPLAWNERKERGMDTYHDIVDWIGGLPYEVASRDETVSFLGARGFALERVNEYPERWNNIYLLSRRS
jgi:2-polyprenyl-6-hydroxyphenyl methylase/3-demethylubiquinone-9 3-methyltransferase